jgi:hypothetical protein
VFATNVRTIRATAAAALGVALLVLGAALLRRPVATAHAQGAARVGLSTGAGR